MRQAFSNEKGQHEKVVNWFLYVFKNYGIRIYKVGYDNWQMKDVIKGLEDMGCDTERVGMDYACLSNPMKLVEADLKSKTLVYNNNEIDKWCLGNTGIKVNNIGQIMPVKIETNLRIDGAVTKFIAYAIYNRYRNDYLDLVG